jgi:hypothetical protein
MGVYHVPVGREEKREWWDPMMSPKVTWTLLSVPLAMVDVGDSCALWTRRVREIEFWISGVGEGSEYESFEDRNPECETLTKSPEVLKSSKMEEPQWILTVGCWVNVDRRSTRFTRIR